jgi:hypothetical protein
MTTTQNSEKTVGKKRRGKVENLKPWKEGESGNPGGRPKRRPISEVLLDALLADDGKLLHKFVEAGLKKAIAGDFTFWKEIREAIEGKSPLPLVGPEEGPLSVSDDVDERLTAVIERLRARAAERGGHVGVRQERKSSAANS